MAYHSRSSRGPAPGPVTVLRPDSAGNLTEVATIAEPPIHRFNDYESESIVYRYRLIAVQETGEEMFAGRAKSYTHAEQLREQWLRNHPEHRSVSIELI